MSKKLQEQFRDNIPSALRNNDLILEYAEAIGEVYEEIRQDINYKAYESDYAKSRFLTFDSVTSNIGLQLSPFLKENVTRRILRDMPSIYTRLGTRGSLEWALKTLGYRSFQIDEVWIPNPDLIRKGYFRKLFDTKEPRRFDIRPRSYTDFVVGEEYVTNQGTFFKGYQYNDFEKKDVINGVPIYGEGYSTYTGLSFKDMVSKTPYIVARLYDAPLYDEVVTDVDPTTGDPIVLTPQEKQKIITDTIRYLIQNLQRTATTSIILVTDLLIFNDILGRMVSAFDVAFTSDPYDVADPISQLMDQPLVSDAYVDANKTQLGKIGSKKLIGRTQPFPATGEYVGAGEIGLPTGNTNFVGSGVVGSVVIGVVQSSALEILDGLRGQNLTTYAVSPSTGYEHVHFLDYAAQVSFTAPAGVSVTVEKIRNFHHSATTDRVTVATVSGGTAFNEVIADSHAVILTFGSDHTGTVNITSTYP